MASSPPADSASPRKSPFDSMSREELINKCKGLLTIAQKAKHAKSEYQNEIEDCKAKLDKCESEKKSAQENIQTLQDIVNSLTEQKLSYITEIDSTQTKLKALNTKVAQQEEEINKLEAELKYKEKTINETVQKFSEFDNEVVSLKRQNNRLLEENEQLINQLAELEARTAEVNEIGLQQREQLRILEAQLQSESSNEENSVELNKKISELEEELNKVKNGENEKKLADLESKLLDMTHMYESEKAKKEKANLKLKSYKEKIIKCSSCITQLKNSRFILTKTINEYSENIPKWQHDILKASKVLDEQINLLNKENCSLKEKLNIFEVQNREVVIENNKLKEDKESLQIEICNLEKQLSDLNNKNKLLSKEIEEMNISPNDNTESTLKNENKFLKKQNDDLSQKYNECIIDYKILNDAIANLRTENDNLKENMTTLSQNSSILENLNLQVKSLEKEKDILVKEKLNARDNVSELEGKNKALQEQVNNLKSEVSSLKSQLDNISQEKNSFELNYKEEKEGEINMLHCRIMSLQEKYDLLKKEHDDLADLNGLLKEEVETLKLSLEQPKDDSDNMSDLNASLQADLVKLETKLSAYKQENSSLLTDVKESRAKLKEYDAMLTDYEETKTKLSSYKSENAELLNEMKEINQVLKERGEAISKLQKAITEMERLIETLEKDRNGYNEERENFLKRIESLEEELKEAQEKNPDQHSDNIAKPEVDNESDKILLIEKETIITSLKEEIEKLKQQQHNPTADLPNEDMSTSTISKAEEHSRMKDLDETFEEKYSKLRIFALKLKKKLNETTAQLQNVEQDKIKLERLLNDNKVPTSKDEVDSCDRSQENIVQMSELESKIKTLTLELEASRDGNSEAEKLRAELNAMSKQLAEELEAHKVTKDNLDKARREAKKKNVLSLEMEDYERSMKDLTNKMEEYKKKMVQMESTIDTQEGTITAMKTQIKLLEEQIKTEETQNRLTKEELHHTAEDSKEKDNIIQAKSAIIAQLERELEEEKRMNEGAKLEIMATLSEKEKIIMNLGEDKVELNSKVKRLEFKCTELEEKLRVTNIEIEDLKAEYTSYKVRAQSVLRQNQTVDHSQEEQLKEEAAALKAQVETLSVKLKTAQEQCAELSAEAETNKRRAAEATSEATRAQQRTTRLHTDVTRLTQQLESERSQHKIQVSTLTQCYKTQISDLEARLQQQTEDLRNQLAAVQEKLKSGASASVADVNKNPYLVPVIPRDDSDMEMDINVSMIPREEGEGSESAPSPPLSKSFLNASGRRSPMPLERLLEEGVPEDESLDTSSLGLTQEQEISELKRKLQSQQQRVKHVTVLLSESERECARMAQLSELLKAELRRLRGTTSGAHNTEYMKNVTLKFLTLPPGDERSRLVPVLQKILTLSHEDTQNLLAVAKGVGGTSKGWGSYLPWPGGK